MQDDESRNHVRLMAQHPGVNQIMIAFITVSQSIIVALSVININKNANGHESITNRENALRTKRTRYHQSRN